ncbi:hypothetical protein FACS189483_05240 [Spirochaetia bacterium]|nr:hypothetical protein FACS189483_05240 [Spirochaetia bacterium]
MAFVEAERTQLYLRCALFGPSGSGKTMTALRMAKGIAEKMGVRYAVIDTEARSASKYADRYKFVVDNLENKTVDGYIKAMHEAYDAGYKVLVIDSLSHAWRELTDEVDRITQASNSKNSFLSWAKVNPKQKRLVEAILHFPGHIIATMRSKTEWIVGEGKGGKTAPEKLGLAPEQGKGIEYEFDLLVELNQQHQAIVTKDRTGKFQDETIDKPGEEFGAALFDWLASGNAIPQTPQSAAVPTVPAATAQKTNQNTPVKSTPAATTQNTETASEGDTVLLEIADVIGTVAADGKPYFTEEEKEEARQLVRGVKKDKNGVKELRDFKDLLTTLLTDRKPNAVDKAA